MMNSNTKQPGKVVAATHSDAEVKLHNLVKNQFTQLSDLLLSPDQYSRWDAENSGFIVEYKRRFVDYGDALVEQSKVQEMRAESKRSHRTPYLFSETDTLVKIIKINAGYTIKQMWASKTTDFSNNEKVLKDFAIWKDQDIFRIYEKVEIKGEIKLKLISKAR